MERLIPGGLLVAVVLALLVLPACGRGKSGKQEPAVTTYDRLLRTLYHNTVPVVQPAQLAATLRQQPAAVVLLDTRTPTEYRISHLRGARFVDFDSFEKNTFADLPRTQPIVVYCSVGYRSERVGERLKALGFQDVRNLYGGIFQWVNEGQPVYDAQGPTTRVHPYSPLWRPWLKSGQAAYE